jgi:hypothetical protein
MGGRAMKVRAKVIKRVIVMDLTMDEYGYLYGLVYKEQLKRDSYTIKLWNNMPLPSLIDEE